jgi:hypothetical protein
MGQSYPDILSRFLLDTYPNWDAMIDSNGVIWSDILSHCLTRYCLIWDNYNVPIGTMFDPEWDKILYPIYPICPISFLTQMGQSYPHILSHFLLDTYPNWDVYIDPIGT